MYVSDREKDHFPTPKKRFLSREKAFKSKSRSEVRFGFSVIFCADSSKNQLKRSSPSPFPRTWYFPKMQKPFKTMQNLKFCRFQIQNQLLLEILVLWVQKSAPYDEIWLLYLRPKSLSSSQRLFCEKYDIAAVTKLVHKLTDFRGANV